MPNPVLVATAHGTDNPAGQAIISSVVRQVAQRLPLTRVVETYVDVQHPQIGEVLSGLADKEESIVVPLLLSTGYHTVHDIAGAVANRTDHAASSQATQTLGPHTLLAAIQVDRILEVSKNPSHIVVVAAGSSDSRAQNDVTEQASLLSQALAGAGFSQQPTVSIAYLSAAEPTLPQVLNSIAEEHPEAEVVLSSYLLAPGFFQNKIERLARTASLPPEKLAITQPLGDDPRLAHIVEERYLAAVSVD